MKGFTYFEKWLIEGRIGILKELKEEFRLYDEMLKLDNRIKMDAELSRLTPGNELSVLQSESKIADECDEDSKLEAQPGNDVVEVQNENVLTGAEFELNDNSSGRCHDHLQSGSKRKAGLRIGDEKGPHKKLRILRSSVRLNCSDRPGVRGDTQLGSTQEDAMISPSEQPSGAGAEDHHHDPTLFESEVGDKSSSVNVVSTSQSPEKSLSAEEQKSLKDQLMINLPDSKKAVRAARLEVAASNPHVNEILPSLINMICNKAYLCYKDPELMLLYRLRLLESLFNNPNVHLAVHVSHSSCQLPQYLIQLHIPDGPSLDFLYDSNEANHCYSIFANSRLVTSKMSHMAAPLTSALPGRPECTEHWEPNRTLAASLLGRVFKLLPKIMEGVQGMVGRRLQDEDRPIGIILYGSILIVKELGDESIQTLLLPRIKNIGEKIKDCLSNPESSPTDIVPSQQIKSLIVEVISPLLEKMQSAPSDQDQLGFQEKYGYFSPHLLKAAFRFGNRSHRRKSS